MASPKTPTAQARYRGYLAGVDWQVKRGEALVRAGFQCQQCGSPYGLEVHHKTYARLEEEADEDLEVLCRACHRAAHAPN